MPRPGAMGTGELVIRLQARQAEILNSLPPELLAEYRAIDLVINRVKEEEKKKVSEHKNDQTIKSNNVFLGTPIIADGDLIPASSGRIPLARQKQKLIEFLVKRFQATRTEIVNATGIPAGSLSELLSSSEDFTQVKHGVWTLATPTKKPGPSAPPQSEKPT